MNATKKEDVVLALINEFGCEGHLGRTLLHSACASGNGSLVRIISKYISSWVVDDNGDTPLHVCLQFNLIVGQYGCVEALLKLPDPPVMIRNNFGKTARDYGRTSHRSLIDQYLRRNRSKVYAHYEVIQRHAKKKY